MDDVRKFDEQMFGMLVECIRVELLIEVMFVLKPEVEARKVIFGRKTEFLQRDLEQAKKFGHTANRDYR
jgi:hypothetical protein